MEEEERNEDIYVESSLGRGRTTGAKVTAQNLGSGTLLCDFLPRVAIVEFSEWVHGQTGSSKQELRGWLRGPESWGKVFLFYSVPNVSSS